MKRPLFLIGVACFLSSAAALFFGDNFALSIGLFLLISCVVYLLANKAAAPMQVTAVLFVAGTAMLMTLLQNLWYIRPTEALAGKTVYLQGRITEIEYAPTSARYILDAQIPMKDGKKLKTQVLLYSYSPLPVQVNEGIKGFVELYLPEMDRMKTFQRRSNKQILNCKVNQEIVYVKKEDLNKDIGFRITELQEYLVAQNNKLLGSKEAGVVNAMLFGRKEYLDETIREDFKRSGIMHLTAVSGFHVSLITSLLIQFFSALGFKRRARAVLAFPFMLLFMALAGFTSSVLRAGIMMSLYLFAQVVSQKYDALNALGFALFGICIVNPYSALNTGFLLSFSATLGIIVISPVLTSFLYRKFQFENSKSFWNKIARYLTQLFSVSCAAFLFTLPVMLYRFDSISVIAPISSAFLVPVATLMMWGATFCLLIGTIPLFFPCAVLLSIFIRGLVHILAGLAHIFSLIPFASIPIQYDYLKILVIVFYAAGVLLYVLHAKAELKRASMLLAAAVFAISCISSFIMNYNTIQLVTFEQTNSVLLIQNSKAALIGFPRKAYQANLIVNYLKNYNIKELEVALGTDKTNDDVLGAVYLFSEVPVRTLIMPTEGRYTENLYQFARKARQAFPSYETSIKSLGLLLSTQACSCGYTCEINAGVIKILKTNENCVIIKRTPPFSALLHGWEMELDPEENSNIKKRVRDENTIIYSFRT